MNINALYSTVLVVLVFVVGFCSMRVEAMGLQFAVDMFRSLRATTDPKDSFGFSPMAITQSVLDASGMLSEADALDIVDYLAYKRRPFFEVGHLVEAYRQIMEESQVEEDQQFMHASPARRSGPRPARRSGPSARSWTAGGRWRQRSCPP